MKKKVCCLSMMLFCFCLINDESFLYMPTIYVTKANGRLDKLSLDNHFSCSKSLYERISESIEWNSMKLDTLIDGHQSKCRVQEP